MKRSNYNFENIDRTFEKIISGRKKPNPEPDWDNIRYSIINTLKCAYNDYKLALIDQLKSSSIGNNGEFIIVANCEKLAKKVEITQKRYTEKLESFTLFEKDRNEWYEKYMKK